MRAYVKDENSNANNSTAFFQLHQNVHIEDDEIIVSFDVTSSFTNIPTADTLNIIKDYVNKDDRFTKKTALPQDKFCDLIDLVLKVFWNTFNSQFYQQVDGVAMGGAASLATTEMYVQTAISTPLQPPKFLERFVDEAYSKH